MNDREYTLDAMRRYGKQRAQEVQTASATMTGTELNAEDGFIPEFKIAVSKMNMLKRPIGFVCKSSAGRVVKLLQPYDSTIYTQEPEELPAQFGFVWSQDPAKAKPFVAMATSPYMIGDCCSVEVEKDGREITAVYRSLIDNNVHSPLDYPAGWELVA